MNPQRLETIPPALQSTPWGPAQDAFKYAEGLIFVHTAGHGGFWCGPERWLKIRATWPDWRPFGDRAPWLEEDNDAALAALAWPELFGDQAVFNAVRTLQGPSIDRGDRGWRQVATWLHFTPAGSAVHARFYRFKESIADLWERGGLSGGPEEPGWKVSFYRGPAGITRQIREYPLKQFYTDQEVEALTLTEKEIKAWQRSRASEVERRRYEQHISAARLRAEPGSAFSEAECGGAFDGFTVTSDADPGL